MKNMTIKAAVIAALGLASAQAPAAWEVLPTAGLTSTGTTGTPKVTAYRTCNATGDFGSGTSTPPTTTADKCAVFPSSVLAAPAPYNAFSLVALNNQDVDMLPAYAGADPTVANVTDAVWRNAAGTECVYGVFVWMYDEPLAPGNGGEEEEPGEPANWEVNDIARGGFADKGTVDIAYYYTAITDESVFRAGRTHTAVRHRASGSGDISLPIFTGAGVPAASTAITNVQKAALSSNWVDFTTDVNARDPDGSSFPQTSVMYVHSGCTSATPALFNDAIRLRSTGQEDQTQIEVKIQGYAPAGATINSY
jgi:hypothetical protein